LNATEHPQINVSDKRKHEQVLAIERTTRKIRYDTTLLALEQSTTADWALLIAAVNRLLLLLLL